MRCEHIKFSVIALLIVLGLSFILAAHIITPTSFSVNETIENTFNITVNNTDAGATANITYVNITIPTNFTFISGTNGTNASASTFENTSTVLSWLNTSASTYLVNGSEVNYFWFNATATPGNYNITVTTFNITSSYTTNISVTVNDTTNPTASLGTSPVDNANSSTAANIFDIKCSDAYSPNTLELWGNWSGTWAANNTNTSIVNNTYSNITVTLSDGVYLWGAYCNDTAGNAGWSAANRTLTVDTTSPGATATCTPATVYEGSLVTCTCSGTDATSGIDTTTATTAVYQRTIGTFTYTCSVTDYSGNSASNTATYNVIAYGGGTPSASTTITWTATQLITATQFEESFSKELSVKERLKMRIDSVYHHVGVKELTATTATIEIASDPQEAILSIGDERKFEVSGDNYYDILVKLNSIESNKANITIQSINELVTTETTEEEEQKETESTDTKQQEQAPPTPEESNKNTLMWTIITIAVIVLIIIILYAKSKKKK